MLDESSSMIKPWSGGQPKYKVADELIMRLMDSVYAVNGNVEFSLRVFGHQNTVEENNCYDTRNEVAFAKDNRTQMSLRLSAIRPLGVTPIAFSLIQAAEQDLVATDRNAYSIILITDGGESCGGDICAVMKALIDKKVYFRPYIIGLEDDATLRMLYACMGNYLQVTKEDDISKALSAIVTAFHPLLTITKADYKEPAPATVPAKETVPVKPKPVEKKPVGERIPQMPVVALKPVATSNFKPTDALPARPAASLPTIVKDTFPSAPAPPPTKPVADKITAMPTAQLRPAFLNVAKLIDSQPFSLIMPSALPPLVRDTLEMAPVAPTLPMKEDNPDFKLSTVNAKETSLELYFMNGKGRLYMSKPTVVLVNHATGQVERSFRRVVDVLGNIDVQTKIPTGYYDITLPHQKKAW